MSNQYIGEIRLVGMNFAPVGWLMCDGSLQSISNYDTLYALLGTTYGGDGQSTFAMPDLRGRVPIHTGTLAGGSTYPLGQLSGQAAVTLNSNQLPAHSHTLACNNAAGAQGAAAGNYFAGAQEPVYSPPGTAYVSMASVVSPVGGNQSHDNMQPYQVLNYIIATEGIFPSQS